MEIQLSEEIFSQLKEASQKLGFNNVEVINRALALYLRYIQSSMSLNEELESWEAAGIEDLNYSE